MLALTAVLGAAGTAEAPESIATNEPELPASVRIRRDFSLLRRGPSRKAGRRGEARKGARLPVLEQSPGPGCRSVWYRVHRDAWICGDRVEVSDVPPFGLRHPVVPHDRHTPWPYGFIREPSIEYHLEEGLLMESRELQVGFGLGVAGSTNWDGERFVRTVEGNFIPRSSVGISGRVSTFQGVALEPDAPANVGWVIRRRAWVYSHPKADAQHRMESLERLARFEVIDGGQNGSSTFYSIGADRWVRRRDVRVWRRADRPESVEPDERWIDVDLRRQIVTAYEGDRPVYVTLISSGRGGPSRTVRGEFRIWAKVSAIDMDNTDEEVEIELDTDSDSDTDSDTSMYTERRVYSLHDVPWTQFFHDAYALHGVYWHNRFGYRRSHGCVNLAPADAHWLFDWTSPRLPDGWWAMHAMEADRPTLVRVR